MAATYTKCQYNLPNGRKIYKQFPFQGPKNLPKFGFLE
jgi:hypothetical protein